MAGGAPRIDPVAFAGALIRCPSVTPEDAGALGLLEATLRPLGFACHRLRFEEAGTAPVDNLYARLGDGRPNFCFAGHTDVVPAGNVAAWQSDPFAGTVADGKLWGRGAADMKGAIAAFVAAAARYLDRHGRPPGAISLLITGDEEGPSINGTKKVLGWLAGRSEALDACIVGEPTNPEALGDMIKIGRRGSLHIRVIAHGTQGHTAYPHLADNPVHRLVRLLDHLVAAPLDFGTAHFQPTTLQVSTVDVGNPAGNVIPAEARAAFNIRFNDLHSSASLIAHVQAKIAAIGGRWTVEPMLTGESFLTPPGRLSDTIVGAVRRVTGREPELSTTGGTSDARFIKDHCQVAEFGLVGQTMHKVDEHAATSDIERLADIYLAVLEDWFRTNSAAPAAPA
ncbi:MAG: succinyl-diaminopimelate desuccinylase [Alphaproteobacteria bacterium]|nr:succinyl-diaminopimelate desuccinylase [Alphaproteobacteria bacterium]